MKRKLLVSLLITMLAVLTISSCGIANKAVSNLQIISGAPTEVEVGKTPDFSELLGLYYLLSLSSRALSSSYIVAGTLSPT